MKILRWLLSHSFLILLIVVVIYGYMFWGNLLGKETPAGKAVAYLSDEFDVVGDFVNAIRVKQAKLNGDQASDQTAGSPASAMPDTNETTASTVQAAAADDRSSLQAGASVEQQTEQLSKQLSGQPSKQPSKQIGGQTDASAQVSGRAIDDKSSQNAAEKNLAAFDVQPVTDETAATEVLAQGQIKPGKAEQGIVDRSNNTEQSSATQSSAMPNSTEQPFVPPEIEKQLDNVDKQGRVIDETQKDKSIKADWIIARKSFFQRNYELSEQSYHKVIENSQDNFDAYGELGNVYFNQGKNQQAASAYFEAAAILVRKGQVSRARSLMGLLRHLDKSKANELQRLIDLTMSS